jgi:hypothetical protein
VGRAAEARGSCAVAAVGTAAKSARIMSLMRHTYGDTPRWFRALRVGLVATATAIVCGGPRVLRGNSIVCENTTAIIPLMPRREL